MTLSLTLMLASSAAGQGGTPKVRAAVALVPPFAMQQNGSLTGFSIDLWNAVAARLKLETDYHVSSNSETIAEEMRSKTADILITPILITEARDREFDFTFPIMETGLQIMVRDTGETAVPNPLEDLLGVLFSKTTLVWLGIAVVLVLIPAHLVWLLERPYKGGIIASTEYFPGIFEAMYWAVSCLTTQAEKMPLHWIARVLSVFWMFAGVVFVAFYTAQLTTTLTIRQIRGAIGGPEDLAGKKVATITNSVVVDYLRTKHAQVQEWPNTHQMFQALLDRKADAIVFPTPVLLYYAAHEGKGLVKVVGSAFNTAPVAFCVQTNSPLRRPVNSALLALNENGTYQQLHNKWFGTPP